LGPKKVDGIKFSLNYEEKEPVFWRVFKELANENNGLVDYDKLQQRFVNWKILC
jgi:hypothetical protein